MSLRRMLPFIFVNIVVSAVVVLLVLSWWDSRQEEPADTTPVSIGGLNTPVATGPTAAIGETSVAAAPTVEAGDDGPTIHIVQAGDTLGKIAELYDVSVEDIATANEIVNVNTIAIGQELLIPIGGLPTETPLPTAQPTQNASPTPLPTEPPAPGTVVVEITEVIGVGDLATEAVRITNVGTRQAELRGWQLFDEQGHIYRFVDATLYGSSAAGSPAILIHTEAGQNGPSDLYWGQEMAVWESGETVTLRDAEETVQATYEIP